MIKSIVREHHWAPSIINNLYADNIDHLGIVYWFNDLLEVEKDIKKTK